MKESITIGRSPSSDILVEEKWDTVSNRHATLTWKDDTLVFEDHSRNGSTVRGQVVHNREVYIYPGDDIRLGGAYQLQWGDIRRYFPQINRPTVENNVRAAEQNRIESPNNGRETMPLDKAPSGRRTEQLSRQHQDTPPNQHRQTSHKSQVPKDGESMHIPPYAEVEQTLNKWNWGAFFCGWIWAVYHKLYWPLAMIVVVFIPYIGQIAGIVISVWLGINGNRIAWKSERYKDLDDMRQKQTIWGWAGLAVFIASICLSAYSAVLILSMANL